MAHPYQKHRDASHTRVKQVLKADGGEVDNEDIPRWGQTHPTSGTRDMVQDRSNARMTDLMKSVRVGRERAESWWNYRHPDLTK